MFCSSCQISRVLLVAVAAITLSVSGCGGGGGGSSSSTTTPPVTTPVTPPASGIVSPMGCGTVTSTGSGNVTPLVVDGFPCAAAGTAGVANFPEQPYISVKICAPGSTTNCQIIDHILVDTGSTGLRIADSALSSTLKAALPAVTNGSATTTVSECEQYVSSYVWGPVVNVDVSIAGKSATGTQMQIFGNSGFSVPSACSTPVGSTTPLTQTDSITSFGGNGLLGVSFSLLDYSSYFDCPDSGTGTCTQNNFSGLPNIVYNFASDNNGVVITLPAVGASGSVTPVVGTLTFGVSTESNNTPVSTLFTLLNDGNLQDYTYATFQAEVGGVWNSAYIDSGTDIAYFNDPGNSSLTACSNTNFNGLYCPATTQSVIFNYANYTTGTPTSQGTFALSVIDPSLFNSNVIAFNNVAGPITNSTTASSDIALGFVTFFGHTNYILFSGQQIPGTGFGSQSTIQGPMNGIN